MTQADSASTAVLDGLPAKVRAEVLKSAKRRTFAPGDVLVHEGDSGLYLFIVESGHAHIDVAGRGEVARIGPGDFFGEQALLDDRDHVRTATVTADEELVCVLIPGWEFKSLLETHPAMALPMLRRLIARLHGH